MALEPLEGRIAPAVAGVLSLSGSALVYTAFNTGGSHQVNVTTSGSGFTVNDTAGTILSIVPGFSGTGTSTVMGAIPAIATTVNIQAGNGTTALNLGSAGAGLSLPNDALVVSANTIASLNTVTARSITLNAGAGGTAIGSSLTSTAGSLTLNGSDTETINATLSATGGNVAINGSLNGAGHTLTINDNGGSVTSAGSLSGLTGLMVAPALNITLGAASVAGPIVLTANNNVTLNGTLNDTGSTVTIEANWTGTGAGNFTQNVGGDIGGTPSAVSILLNNGGGTGSAIVRGITTAPGGSVTLNTLGTGIGGAIIDGNGPGVTNVTAGTLIATAGPGGLNLDTSIATLISASASGSTGLGQVSIRNTGGPLAVQNVATANGPISISNNNVLNINGAVGAGGTHQSVGLTTSGAGGNINFGTSGFVGAVSGSVFVNSSGSVNHGGFGDDIHAQTVVLNAVSGIGTSGAPLQVDTGTLTATNSSSANIFLTTTSSINYGPITATLTNTASPGNITLSQFDGQPLTVFATTTNGTIAITNTGGNLTASNVVSGNNQSISLNTTVVGNIALGTVNAGTGAVNVTSAGDIAGPGLITAGTVNLAAVTGIGSSGAGGSVPMSLSGPAVVTATNSTSGGIFFKSVGTSPVNFGTTAPGIVAGGSGNVALNAAGAVTLGNGANAIATNNGAVIVTSSGLMILNNVNTSTSNGAVSLTTTGGANVQLAAGSITAGTGTVTINSSGAILDASPAVTAGTVNLTAATNIGTPGTPVTTAAAVVNATAGTGVWLSNPSGTVNYNDVIGAQIGITSGGPTTVTNASSSAAGTSVAVTGASLTVGTITATGQIVNLSTSGSGNIALGAVTSGSVTINSAGDVTGSGTTSPGTVNVTSSSLSLTASTGVGTSGANGVNTKVPSISATTATGGVWINSLLTGGSLNPVSFTSVAATTSGPVVLAAHSDLDVTGPITATSGNVSVTDNGGAIMLNAAVSGGAVTITGSGDVTNNTTITGTSGVTITAGSNSSAANLTNNGTVTNGTGSGAIALVSGASSNTAMTLGGAITANNGGGVTITGGNVGNAISLTAVVTTVGGGNLKINGGSGIDTINFNLGAGSSVSGNVAINAQGSTATMNVTDPTAAAVTGTFTIDFGAGHTTSDTLNIFGTGAALVPGGATPPTVPTGVTFTAGYTPWILSNFIVGQDHLPGFGY